MKKLSIKETMTRHGEFIYFMLSFFMILIIFLNSLIFHSPFIGTPASIVYILINGNFMGDTFFRESKLKLPLGTLLLVCWLGILGWLFMIFYGLTIVEVTLVLCITSFLSFLMFEREKVKIIFGKRKRSSKK